VLATLYLGVKFIKEIFEDLLSFLLQRGLFVLHALSLNFLVKEVFRRLFEPERIEHVVELNVNHCVNGGQLLDCHECRILYWSGIVVIKFLNHD